MMGEPMIMDICEMPGWNPATSNDGDRSVTKGLVYWDEINKVCCVDHKAMLAVNQDRSIWRCIACGVGAYVVFQEQP